MPVTHLTGPVITIGPRVIQRCAVCGLKLVDNVNYPLKTDGTVEAIPVWQPRCFIRQEGDPPTWTAVCDLNDDDDVPEDFCLELVEE